MPMVGLDLSSARPDENPVPAMTPNEYEMQPASFHDLKGGLTAQGRISPQLYDDLIALLRTSVGSLDRVRSLSKYSKEAAAYGLAVGNRTIGLADTMASEPIGNMMDFLPTEAGTPLDKAFEYERLTKADASCLVMASVALRCARHCCVRTKGGVSTEDTSADFF
eukprot:GEMP01091863.1.p1 GENE.GEMP01091863.1~~GEMP01091863.1.p1  ORF type:complete len:165 (+),score=39.71 GEMP01091863.1:66-560(+)